MVMPSDHVGELKDLLEDRPMEEFWYDHISENLALIKILARLEETEALIDLLNEKFSHVPGFRLILLPVVASLPRVEEEKPPEAEKTAADEKRPERVNREELYNSIRDMARPTKVYFALASLSTVVAAIGIVNNNVAVVIGAMVIAPLLGPVIAMSLATILGDLDLARLSVKALAGGVLLALGISIVMGYFFQVEPNVPWLANRAQVGLENVFLALAAGFAGALAFSAGVSAALVGVMVAVALLPPLVTMGLLLGSGLVKLAGVVLIIFLINVLCISLAGVISFWIQGIRPSTGWEADRARKATRLAIGICSFLLALLIALIFIVHIPDG